MIGQGVSIEEGPTIYYDGEAPILQQRRELMGALGILSRQDLQDPRELLPTRAATTA